MARRWWMVAIAVLALSGCGHGVISDPILGPIGDQQNLDRQRQQAQGALDRYDEALSGAGRQPRFIPVGEVTGQVGDWEEYNGQNKAALGARRVITATTLPSETPPGGRVAWEDGTVLNVPIISAQQAWSTMVSVGQNDCPECAPLEITGARLSTARIQTTRGPAAAPAWEFTLKGTAVRLTQVAVDGSATVTVVPPPWDSNHPPDGLSVESATSTASGTRISVKFVGSPGPASEPCGVDYTAEAIESENAVVVIVVQHPYPGPYGPNEGCTAIGFDRSATVDLVRPLGERAVLEVRQGLPVPVTITG